MEGRVLALGFLGCKIDSNLSMARGQEGGGWKFSLLKGQLGGVRSCSMAPLVRVALRENQNNKHTSQGVPI